MVTSSRWTHWVILRVWTITILLSISSQTQSLETRAISCVRTPGSFVTCSGEPLISAPGDTLACARLCLRDENCMSFVQDQPDGECYPCRRGDITEIQAASASNFRYLCHNQYHFRSPSSGFHSITVADGLYKGQIIRFSGIVSANRFIFSFRKDPCETVTGACVLDTIFEVELDNDRLAARKYIYGSQGSNTYYPLEGKIQRGVRFEILVIPVDNFYYVYVEDEQVAEYGRLLIASLGQLKSIGLEGEYDEIAVSYFS